jgi:hypothetical protein
MWWWILTWVLMSVSLAVGYAWGRAWALAERSDLRARLAGYEQRLRHDYDQINYTPGM